MPTYCYECQSCDYRTEFIKPMAESDTEEKCPVCQVVMNKDYAAESLVGHGDFATPIESWAMKVKPRDVEKHRKMFPGVDITNDGRPILRNRQQQLDYCRKRGFQDNNSFDG